MKPQFVHVKFGVHGNPDDKEVAASYQVPGASVLSHAGVCSIPPLLSRHVDVLVTLGGGGGGPYAHITICCR